MRRGILVKAAYRVLKQEVAAALIGTFVICIAGGMLMQRRSGSLRWLFLLFAFAFIAQSIVFLGARYSATLRNTLTHPGRVEQNESLVFGVGILSAVAAAFLFVLAFV